VPFLSTLEAVYDDALYILYFVDGQRSSCHTIHKVKALKGIQDTHPNQDNSPTGTTCPDAATGSWEKR